MKILVSNDDGIQSKGIEVLAEALKEIADVTVVAPATEQSAVGHAITMKIPLRVKEVKNNGELFGYSVDGTPADCIKMGVRNILEEKPDLVVSGINHGSNTAVNIIYSGTVSAAREATIMGIPAIAMSITDHNPEHFDAAAKIVKELAKQVYENGLVKGTCLNVNVPNLPEEQIKGISFTEQGKSSWADLYEQRVDPYGNEYFWLKGELIEVDNDISKDQFAVKQDHISITPIHFDLTDYETLEEIKTWDLNNFPINKD